MAGTTPITVRMPNDLIRALDKQAEIEDRSRAKIINRTLAEQFLTPKPIKWKEIA